MEQVCEALNLLCWEWQESKRGTSYRQYRLSTIGYHQRRNRAARESRHSLRGQPRRRLDASPESGKGQRSSIRPP